VIGVVFVSTTRGNDGGLFYFDPLDPDPDDLSTFTMDPAMETAQLTVKVGSVRADVTLSARGEPQPAQSAHVVQFENTGLTVCIDTGAGVSVVRSADVTGSIRSSRVGGGTLTSGSGEMIQGIGAGADLSFVPASGWFVLC
jgi:hypothetical protein